ncbi:hypothetical protein FRC01_002589 [Tulasnella sp. 417]|nr:hypothetical protein FRC01_002589 [Tulasnella sp. 417]
MVDLTYRIWLIKSLARLFVPPLAAVALALRVLDRAKGVQLHPAYQAAIYVLSLPVYWTSWIKFTRWGEDRRAEKRGAKLPPIIERKKLGNIDLITRDHDVLKYILSIGFNDFEKGPQAIMRFGSFLGTGIFGSDGERARYVSPDSSLYLTEKNLLFKRLPTFHSFQLSMHLKTSSLLILSSAAIAAVNGMPLELPTDGLKPDRTTTTRGNSGELTSSPMTNAQRFAMASPPSSQRHFDVVQERDRPEASMLPAVRCNILVEDADNGISFGYLKPEHTFGGFYGVFQQSQANALEVSFSTPPGDDLATQLDLFVENAPIPRQPYLGGLVFYSRRFEQDISTGSWTFAGIGGSEATTPAGEPPAAVGNTVSLPGWASAIWNYDPVTREITAQWIAVDGSSPRTYLAYLPSLATIGFTGDADGFKRQTGGKALGVGKISREETGAKGWGIGKIFDIAYSYIVCYCYGTDSV